MSIKISNISNNQFFGTWLERQRQVIQIISSNTVTADASFDGSVNVGNTQHRGIFYANVSVAGVLRGGNVNSFGNLSIISNTIFRSQTNNTVLSVVSNGSVSNVSLTPDTLTINPVSNATINGQLLTVLSTQLVINSAAVTLATILNQTGNTVFKANSTVNMVSMYANSTLSTVTLSSSNVIFNAANTYFSANVNFDGNAKFNGHIAANTLAVSGNLSVANVTFSLGISVPSLAVVGALSGNTGSFSGNVNFGSNLIKVDTTNGRVGFNTSNTDPSSVVTVLGTITANTFRFADGSQVPTSNSLTYISQSNSSVAVNGGGQIVLTANLSTIAIMDSSANSINFFNNSLRIGTVSANVSISSPEVVTANASVGSLSLNALSTSTANKVIISNTSIQTIDSVPVSDVRSVNWTVELSEANTLSYQLSKIMSTHDGVSTAVTEYAIITTNNVVGVMTTDISGGNMRLRITPNYANAVVRVVRQTVLTA